MAFPPGARYPEDYRDEELGPPEITELGSLCRGLPVKARWKILQLLDNRPLRLRACSSMGVPVGMDIRLPHPYLSI